MKKLVMTVAVLACAASFVSAETVTSANMVGFTKVDAVGGQLTLAALNFDTDGATIQELIGTNVPNLSSIYLWDKAGGEYSSASLNTRGTWVPNLVLELGDAFWIQASGAGTNELIFSGEVLTTDNIMTIPAGVSMTGYYYPVEKDFTTTALSTNLPNLSSIYMWDDAGQSYQSWSKNTRGTWVGTGTPYTDPKGGFWVDNSGSVLQSTNEVPFTP